MGKLQIIFFACTVHLCLSAREVLIIGSGLAGLSAAIQAARGGAQVTVLEKEAQIGGNSMRASSGINSVNTPAQASANIQDAEHYFVDDTIKSGHGFSNQKLVEVLVKNSPNAWRFLHDVGVDLSVVTKTGGHCRARTHRAQEKEVAMSIGTEIIRTLLNYIKQVSGIKIITKARVISLITDNSKKVTGVLVVIDGNNQDIFADAVILATGGFCGHVVQNSLLAQYRPDLLSLSTTNGACASGDGIDLAQSVGARLIDMEKIQVHPTGFVDPRDPLKNHKILAAENLRAVGGILLNHEGKRFVNELGLRDHVTDAIMNNCAPYAHSGPKVSYLVLNESAAKAFQKSALNFYITMGLVQRFETVIEWANFIGVDPEILRNTFINYAQSAARNKDTFGKTTFPVTFSCSEPIYCMLVTPCLHYCMGGVRFDERARVIGENGPINGLYAAGEVTGGLHGANRLAGNSLLECVVFGRIAGNSAAIEI